MNGVRESFFFIIVSDPLQGPVRDAIIAPSLRTCNVELTIVWRESATVRTGQERSWKNYRGSLRGPFERFSKDNEVLSKSSREMDPCLLYTSPSPRDRG